MNQTFIYSVALFMTCLSASALAGVFFEPYLGYSFGKINNGDLGAGASVIGGETSQRQLGARVGYNFIAVNGGLDLSYQSGSLSSNQDASKTDFKTTEMAGYVGIRTAAFIKGYVGYIFSSFNQIDSSPSGPSTKLNGSGMKIGIGFTGIPLVDLTTEYRRISYSSYTAPGASKQTVNNMPGNYFSILVSIPVDL